MGHLTPNAKLRESGLTDITPAPFAELVAADLKPLAEAVAIAGVKLQ
jgi:hypothetical protein